MVSMKQLPLDEEPLRSRNARGRQLDTAPPTDPASFATPAASHRAVDAHFYVLNGWLNGPLNALLWGAPQINVIAPPRTCANARALRAEWLL